MARKGGFISFAYVKQKKHTGVSMDDIISFFQQMSTMLNAGTNLLHALRLSVEQSESEKLAKILKDISTKVASGVAFHQAIAEHPKYFKTHWAQIIHTGEVTGQLGTLMQKLTEYIRVVQKTEGKVISAMMYPLILIGVAVLATFIMLWKVVPTFAEFFADFGAKLPAITEFVIGISNIIKDKGLMVVVVAGIIIFAFRKYIKTPGGKRNLSISLMMVPVFNELLQQSAMEKYATNFALLLKSGTPLLESLKTVQEVFKDEVLYYEAIGEIYANVTRGSGIAASLEATGFFTPMIINMTKMGEESGKLADALEQCAVYYREKVETAVNRVTSLLEPIIVIVMGVVFAGLMGSIYIPMFQLASGPK